MSLGDILSVSYPEEVSHRLIVSQDPESLSIPPTKVLDPMDGYALSADMILCSVMTFNC